MTETCLNAWRPGHPWTPRLRSWIDRYAANRRKRQSIAQLRSLDAGTLKDMAIDCSEIRSLVHGPSEGRRRAHEGD